MAMLIGDYKRRTKATQAAASVSSGLACDPVHVSANVANFQVAPATSVVTLMSINVTSSTGVNVFFKDSAGTIQDILIGALTARDYKMGFYCPWPLYVSTDADLTFYVNPPSKGNTTA